MNERIFSEKIYDLVNMGHPGNLFPDFPVKVGVQSSKSCWFGFLGTLASLVDYACTHPRRFLWSCRRSRGTQNTSLQALKVRLERMLSSPTST